MQRSVHKCIEQIERCEDLDHIIEYYVSNADRAHDGLVLLEGYCGRQGVLR
jgi:hypothetical protein